MMGNNEYKKQMGQIKVPAELTEKTIARIKKEDSKVRLFKKRWMTSAVSAAALLILFISWALVNSTTGPIKTNLKADEYVAEVKLKDGYLYFASAGEVSDAKQFGLLTPNQRQWTREEFEEYIGTAAGLTDLAKSYQVVREEYTVKYEGLEAIKSAACEIEYTNQQNGKINFYYSDASELTASLGAYEMNSKINDIEMRVSYYAAEEEYTALLKKEGFYTRITAVGLSQEEFVMVLYNFLN